MNIPCRVTDERAELLFQNAPDITCEQKEEVKRLFTKHLFYKTRGKNKRDFYCDACDSSFSVRAQSRDSWAEHLNNPADAELCALHSSHNETIRCPRCNAEANVICIGKMRSGKSLEEWTRVVALRKAENGIYAFAFFARALYRLNKDAIDRTERLLAVDKQASYYFSKDEAVMFRLKQSYFDGWGWALQKTIREPFQPQGASGYNEGHDGGYYIIGKSELDASALRYCGWNEYRNTNGDEVQYATDFIKYIARYCERPQLEMLAKLGRQDVIDELVLEGRTNGLYLNWKATTIADFYKLPPADAKLLFDRKDITISEYVAWCRSGKKHGETVAEWLSLIEEAGDVQKLASVRRIAEGYDIRVRAACKYVRRQVKDQKGKPFGYDAMIGFWVDYLQAAKTCGYDLTVPTVLMPPDLLAAHDVTTSQATYIAQKENTDAYLKTRYKNLCKRYAFEYDGLRIIVPRNEQEIINEGKRLAHCVGGYAERHMKGKVTILFLRTSEHPDKPLCTIELQGEEVKQIHGFRNENYQLPDGTSPLPPSKLYKSFLDTWREWNKRGSPRNKDGSPKLKNNAATSAA